MIVVFFNESPLIFFNGCNAIGIGSFASMSLQELLAEKSQEILDAWVGKVMNSYQADGALFFKTQKDRFANPVGYSLKEGLKEVFGSLRKFEEVEKLPSAMLQFIKLRAVQDMVPSEALSFLYDLKEIVRDVCGVEQLMDYLEEWQQLDRAVDKLALLGFDDYMNDRELLHKVKFNDLKRGNNVMTRRTQCPTAMMKENKDVKKELQVILDS